MQVKEIVQQYQKTMLHHLAKVKELETAIKAMQAACEHDYQPNGNHSHNKTYYECSKCLHVTYE